jgi:hypothetical protein
VIILVCDKRWALCLYEEDIPKGLKRSLVEKTNRPLNKRRHAGLTSYIKKAFSKKHKVTILQRK